MDFSWSTSWPWLAAALAFGYLLGSIPFGLLLTRFAGLGDIRKIGSGSIGATNVLRTGSKKLAAATVLLDALKGFAPVILAAHLGGTQASLAAGLGAVLGHLFPVWLGFKGGKGVATAVGVLLALSWGLALAACVLWLLVAFAFRYSSLAALLASAAVAIAAWPLAYTKPFGWTLSSPPLAVLMTVLAALVWARHHENIARLLKGEESRIGASSRPRSA